MNIVQEINRRSKLSGHFVLRSGKTTSTYFDKYRFESDPALLLAIAQAMALRVPSDAQALAGLEMGGIPLVTMLSQVTGLPAAFIRKKAKEYGTCRYSEGADLSGRSFVLVEDVVSSGGAIIDAVEKLRADGLQVERALCVIDRETGGKEALRAIGIQLDSLFTFSEVDTAL